MEQTDPLSEQLREFANKLLALVDDFEPFASKWLKDYLAVGKELVEFFSYHEYAKVVWTIDDVQTLFEVTDEEAQEFLENTAKAIQEQAVQVGWNVIEVHAGMANLKKVEKE